MTDPMPLKRVPRYILLTIGYTLILQAAFLSGLMLRFEGQIPSRYWIGYLIAAPIFTLLSLAGFFVAGLYHGLWRYASTVTLFQIFKGVSLSAMSLVLITLFSPTLLFPQSVIVQTWVWELVFIGGLRFLWRVSQERVLGPLPLRAGRALVVGADHTGVHLIQEMRRGPAGQELLTPIGFIDDDSRITGHMIEGVKVQGTIADLPRVLKDLHVEIVIVSDPDMPARTVREIARFCDAANVRVKTLPGLSDLQAGRTALSQMRDMRIDDLLGRHPVHLNLNEVGEFLRGQRVLVTGAGGSIGSELVRQVAGFEPASLILLDHAENGLYYVHNEVSSLHPSLPIHAALADIQDAAALEDVFREGRPTVVLHAAAHKHVPLLEANPREAVLNNIVGTRNVIEAADRHAVGKFVLISTDKAVNPTSVMGASKRVCEMMVQARSAHSQTRFAAVRFGNVLGSDGSVIPLFQRQLQRGGPLTVTDPEARRYFMTIPEAVRLVLQCGAMGRGGEVFLLDMGEQVRIVDLARQLIRMAGLREGEDIEIVFTGLRPGEKLYEELHSDSERTRITRHERILVWELEPGDEASLLSRVDELEDAARRGDSMEIRARLHSLVPEYFEPLRAPDEAPPTPVVELPAAAVEAVVPGPRWGERMRELADGVIAGIVLLLSIPLWALLWIESRRAGLPSPLVEEIRIGRTRRHGPRREARTRVPIERRSIERRTRNLFGMPLSCLRFSRDLGPVSRWVARHRLDTIPYLFNVLRGEMALVGPKPAREDTVLRWCGMNPEYERRFTVQPGVTGLAQVSGCSEEDLDGLLRRAEYDLYYVQNRSLLLDVRTMVRTLRLVLGGGRKVTRRPKAEVAPAAEPITNATQANGSRAGGLPSSAPPAVKGVTR